MLLRAQLWAHKLTPQVSELWHSSEAVIEGHFQTWSPKMTSGDSRSPQNSPRESFCHQWFWGIFSCFIPIIEKLEEKRLVDNKDNHIFTAAVIWVPLNSTAFWVHPFLWYPKKLSYTHICITARTQVSLKILLPFPRGEMLYHYLN